MAKPKASAFSPPKTETPKPQSKPQEPAAQPKKYDIHDGYGEAKDASEIPADSRAGKAVKYLNTILGGLSCTDIKIKVAEKENAALIELDGAGLGTVIGHRGETLDSIQYLTGLAANNGGGHYAFGQVFLADVRKFDPLPEEFEMAEIREFDTYPGDMRFPGILPVLYERMKDEV